VRRNTAREVRKYIFFSVGMHLAVFAAMLTLAVRDAAYRIPEKIGIVTLVEHEAIEKGTRETPTKKRSGRIHRSTLSAPSVVGRPEAPLSVSEPRESAQIQTPKSTEKVIDNSLTKDIQGGKQGLGPGLTGQPHSGTTSGSTPSNTLETGTPDKGIAAGGHADSRDIAAIRAAIERAKSYPPLARMRGIEGAVTIQFRIGAKGNPEEIRIVKSSGFEILDTAAKKTLLQASPLPPIKGALEVPITFRIDR